MAATSLYHLFPVFLFWGIFFTSSTVATASRSGVHSGRIPSKPETFSKNEFKKSHLRLIPSNVEDNIHIKPSKTASLNSIDSVIVSDVKLPPPLNDLLPKHKLLYQRGIQKDYDYAQFGEPCKIFTVDELEAFLGVIEESINPHEGETHLRMPSPQEKGKQLEELFNHSRAICDFRNLLTCHKKFLTCACAHPSMGVNREGICGINIGHPCELSRRTLQKHGILVIPELSPVKCLLDNAECVMDSENDLLGGGVSPIKRVCKCRNGFWGATCNRRHGPAGIKLVPPKQPQRGGGAKSILKGKKAEEELSEEVEVGRPIWANDVGMETGEYSLHPEEIRDKLVELMNEKEMYPPENRVNEAQRLVRKLEEDVDKEEMVVYDLHLRKLASLNHGDSCDPQRQVILDNPPVARDASHRWTDPHPEDIKSWQLGILQQKKPLCNVNKLLRCNEVTKVCECKPGLELDTVSGGMSAASSCKIPVGHNCDLDFDPILEFDPLKDRKRFSEMDPPNCMPGTDCTDKPMFFQKKCWCSPHNGYCDTSKFDEGLFSSMQSALQSRFTLRLGDSCDPKLHQRLLSYQNYEDSGHEKRFAFFREIIDNPESRLCDIDNYLNCSEVSRTCECWKQLQPVERKDEDYDCVAMNMASCGRTFKYGKYMFTHEGAQLWQVEKTFGKKFLPKCVPGASCTGGNNPEWAGRCLCRDSLKTGETCGDKKSILAASFTASRIPQNDDEETAMLRVFFDLNSQTVLMEQLMTSGINDVCDAAIGLTLDRIVKFWREIANSNDTDSDRRTLPYYIAATKWTKYLVSTVQGSSASLCNATIGLRCHRTTSRCGCHRGSRWMSNKCYLEKDEPCDPKPGAPWVTSCMEGTKCYRVQDNHFNGYRCTPCEKSGTNGACIVSSEEEDVDKDLWDTWNVQDDKVEKQKKQRNEINKPLDKDDYDAAVMENQIALEDEEEKEEPSDEKFLPKRAAKGAGSKKSDEEEVKNYVVHKPKGSLRDDSNTDAIGKKNKTKKPRDDDEEVKHYVVIRPGRGGNDSGTTIQFITAEEAKSRVLGKSSKKKSPVTPSRKGATGKSKAKAPEDMNKRQRDSYIKEIIRMLKEILYFRYIPFGEPCTLEDEEKLSEVFPTLPVYDLAHLPKSYSIPMAYIVLSRLYWKGIFFCDRNKFLKCTREHVCGCSFGFGLIEEDGECRLKEHSYCSRDFINVGKRSIDFVPDAEPVKVQHPNFQCQRGTKCVQIDYGLPICVKMDDLDTDGKKEGKILGRQLYFPNEDFRGNDDEDANLETSTTGNSDKSRSSWTNQQVSTLAIAVAVRLIITLAFI